MNSQHRIRCVCGLLAKKANLCRHGCANGVCCRCTECAKNLTGTTIYYNIKKTIRVKKTIPNQPDFVAILTEKVNDAGIDKLVLICKNKFNKRITNIKSAQIPLSMRRDYIVNVIMKEINSRDAQKISKEILESYFPEKTKKPEKIPEWINDFTVGEEILVSTGSHMGCGEWTKGVIHKINKKTVSVKLYGFIQINDLNAIKNQTWGKHRLLWTRLMDSVYTIHSRGKIIKKGRAEHYDKMFIEGTRDCDYGY